MIIIINWHNPKKEFIQDNKMYKILWDFDFKKGASRADLGLNNKKIEKELAIK